MIGVKKMGYVDLHCDTLMRAWESGYPDLSRTPFSIDLEKLHLGGADAQFFAVFLLPKDYIQRLPKSQQISDDAYIQALSNILFQTIDNNPDTLALALNAQDMARNKDQGKLSAFLTIEDGRSVQGKMENIERYHRGGIRLITLTWNGENCFGFPNSFEDKEMKRGLKPFGKEAVSYMQDIGMLVDVSHLSDGGFYDVATIATKPFIASHSNSRTLSPHPRNLTDDMIRILANAGGVAGLNFAPAFLHPDITSKDSRLEDMVRHVSYMFKIGGEELPALGTDFDGISGNLEISDASMLPILFDQLKKEGIKERQLDKFLFANTQRIIADTLK